MSEAEQRKRVVELARSWVGTPYVSNGFARGRRGGIDCAMLLVGVYREAGFLPPEFDPRPYPSQWHLHRNEERYLNLTQRFARELEAEEQPLPGDVVLFKIARLYAHGAIVVGWPAVIGARGPACVIEEDVTVSEGRHGLRDLPRKFFSPWPKKEAP